MFAIKIEKLWFKGVSPTVYVKPDKTKELKEDLALYKERYENPGLKKGKRTEYRRSWYRRRINEIKEEIKGEKTRKKEFVDFSKPIHQFVDDISDAKIFPTRKAAEKVYNQLIRDYGKISKNIKIIDISKY